MVGLFVVFSTGSFLVFTSLRSSARGIWAPLLLKTSGPYPDAGPTTAVSQGSSLPEFGLNCWLFQVLHCFDFPFWIVVTPFRLSPIVLFPFFMLGRKGVFFLFFSYIILGECSPSNRTPHRALSLVFISLPCTNPILGFRQRTRCRNRGQQGLSFP